MSAAGAISSQISRPSGLSQTSLRSYWMAWRAMRSPVKRGRRRLAAPGMMPSLRAGSVMKASLGRQHVVHGQQDLAMAADGKAVDRRDPWLFDAGAVHVVGQRVGPRHAAQEFMHEAEIALEEPDERDLAAIEMGQVDAGAEQAAAAIFGMLDLAAAQHRDVGLADRGSRRRPRSPWRRAWCRPRH